LLSTSLPQLLLVAYFVGAAYLLICSHKQPLSPSDPEAMVSNTPPPHASPSSGWGFVTDFCFLWQLPLWFYISMGLLNLNTLLAINSTLL
jgi:hypothetical protein